MRTNSRLAAVAALLLLSWDLLAGQTTSTYGEVVRFSRNQELRFPDFTMRYVGERRVRSPIFKAGFLFYDFEVRSPKSTQTVSWSSGTGVIDSASFKVDGNPYELELRGSVLKDGWLRSDELVVWRQADFLKALEKRRGTRP